MRIMALDLGHNNSRTAVCIYETDDATYETRWVNTEPLALAKMLDRWKPKKVLMEACPVSHWVYDLFLSLDICKVIVAATNGEAWRWRNNKKKTDKMDAIKLAEQSVINKISPVHMPTREVRQWRCLIGQRSKLVKERTSVKNAIHSILTREGVIFSHKGTRWTRSYMRLLEEQALPLEEVSSEQIWKGMLHLELERLKAVSGSISQVEARLDVIAAADPRVQLLRDSEKGVGPRFAELVVAKIDKALRFSNGKKVGSYFGMTPKMHQSGDMLIEGRIHKQGDSLTRSMAVEIAWASLRWNPWARDLYEKIHKGSRRRKKTAIVAVARRMLVRSWARLRDYELAQQSLA